MRICSKCNEDKKLTDFFKRGDSQQGYRSTCKKCYAKDTYIRLKKSGKSKQYSANYIRKYPERIRLKNRKQRLKLFGLTIESYEKKYKEQNGKCGICGELKNLVIDHDHSNGSFRGLLCSQCNTGIGLLSDTPNTLLRACMYLISKKFECPKVDKDIIYKLMDMSELNYNPLQVEEAVKNIEEGLAVIKKYIKK